MAEPKKRRRLKAPVAFTAEVKESFLESLAEQGIVRTAAATAGVVEETIRRHQNEDPEFKAAVEAAKAEYLRGLRTEARRRAVEGTVTEEHFDAEGNLVRVKRSYSDSLLAKLLVRHDPDMVERREVKGELKTESRVTTRREVDLKGELKKLDKTGRAALRQVLKQLGAEENG